MNANLPSARGMGLASEYYYLEEIFGQYYVGWFLENLDFMAKEERLYDKMDKRNG